MQTTINSNLINSQNRQSFLSRLWIYQSERFPVFAHGILIAAFTFSAIGYSRICAGKAGFIPLGTYLVGLFITFTTFLLLRLFDEFKDQKEDAEFRTYLPVPRGLVSLKELGWVITVVLILQVIAIRLLQSQMFGLYVLVLGYLLLMRVEFFVPDWLKKRQILYIASHVMIIPLVDIYASGLDWKIEGTSPPFGLLFFFGVSYFNSIVLEFGRKIRTPETEEEGVVSYTKLYGTRGGTIRWIALLLITLILSIWASYHAGYGWTAYSILIGLFVLCSLPGWLFLKNPTEKLTKSIEKTSGIWAIGMYLILGGMPMLMKLL